MLKINKKQIIILGIVLILIVGEGYYLYTKNMEENMDFLYLEENNMQVNEEENKEILEEKQIVVHITGEVKNKGIVTLSKNSRIIDAIEAAGGATDKADLGKINLAFVLSDGQKVYIPSVNDDEEKQYVTQGSGEENEENNSEQVININTANSEQLQKIPGIGESIANRIINYRKTNGKFEKIEDIKNVSGIGEAKFNNMKDYICVK